MFALGEPEYLDHLRSSGQLELPKKGMTHQYEVAIHADHGRVLSLDVLSEGEGNFTARYSHSASSTPHELHSPGREGLSFQAHDEHFEPYLKEVAKFHALATLFSESYADMIRRAEATGSVAVVLTPTRAGEAAVAWDATDRSHTIEINPTFLRPGEGAEVPRSVLYGRVKESLLAEIGNASLFQEFEAVEERAASGTLDQDAENMEFGEAENLLLAYAGGDRVAVAYAKEVEHVEHSKHIVLSRVIDELSAAGVIDGDEPFAQGIKAWAALTPDDAFLRAVMAGHAHKYVDEFKTYDNVSGLGSATPTPVATPQQRIEGEGEGPTA